MDGLKEEISLVYNTGLWVMGVKLRTPMVLIGNGKKQSWTKEKMPIPY